MGKYRVLEKVGAGSFGVVYKAQGTVDHRFYAIKKYKAPVDDEDRRIIATEIGFLRGGGHENVVSFVEDLALRSGQRYLVLEYLPYDLERYLGSVSSPLSPDLIESWAYQLLRGLRFIGRKGYVHCDLKPANILLDLAGRLKICDFSCLRRVGSELLWVIGTSGYIAPEAFAEAPVAEGELDVWGFGCVYFEMHTRRKAFFQSSSHSLYLASVARRIGPPPPSSGADPSSDSEAEPPSAPGEGPPPGEDRWRGEIPEGLRLLVDRSLCWRPRRWPVARLLREGPFRDETRQLFKKRGA